MTDQAFFFVFAVCINQLLLGYAAITKNPKI